MGQNRNQGVQQGGGQQGGDSQGIGQQNTAPRKTGRGFAGMDEARQREIASKGGKAAHEKGTAHEFTSEEARRAGRKGGEVVSQNREHMAMIGREGGQARGNRNRMAQPREFGASPQEDGSRERAQASTGEEETLRVDEDASLRRDEGTLSDDGGPEGRSGSSISR